MSTIYLYIHIVMLNSQQQNCCFKLKCIHIVILNSQQCFQQQYCCAKLKCHVILLPVCAVSWIT